MIYYSASENAYGWCAGFSHNRAHSCARGYCADQNAPDCQLVLECADGWGSIAFAESPAVGVGNPYCHSDPGFVTKLTALGSYTVPKIDVLVSGTLRSDQGAALAANWNAPVALVSAALGRPAAVVVVVLVAAAEQEVAVAAEVAVAQAAMTRTCSIAPGQSKARSAGFGNCRVMR